MSINTQNLTLEQFWSLPQGETAYELVDGQAVPKVSPKYFHSSLQEALLILIRQQCKGKGRIKPEWAVQLKRNERDWVPTPDLTYVSYNRLPKSWRKNEACPVPCEVAIEIISPGQTVREFEDKAREYLASGVSSMWLVEPETGMFRVYSGNGCKVYVDEEAIADPALPDLELTPRQVFAEADLID